MAVLNLNGVDYSGNVMVGTYKVNSTDVFDTWMDANGVNHRQILRKRVSGSFTMQFRNISKYDEFVQHVEESKTVGGWIPCYLFVNNLNTSKSCKMFVDFLPDLDRQNGARNYVPAFEVNVEEI